MKSTQTTWIHCSYDQHPYTCWFPSIDLPLKSTSPEFLAPMSIWSTSIDLLISCLGYLFSLSFSLNSDIICTSKSLFDRLRLLDFYLILFLPIPSYCFLLLLIASFLLLPSIELDCLFLSHTIPSYSFLPIPSYSFLFLPIASYCFLPIASLDWIRWLDFISYYSFLFLPSYSFLLLPIAAYCFFPIASLDRLRLLVFISYYSFFPV